MPQEQETVITLSEEQSGEFARLFENGLLDITDTFNDIIETAYEVDSRQLGLLSPPTYFGTHEGLHVELTYSVAQPVITICYPMTLLFGKEATITTSLTTVQSKFGLVLCVKQIEVEREKKSERIIPRSVVLPLNEQTRGLFDQMVEFIRKHGTVSCGKATPEA